VAVEEPVRQHATPPDLLAEAVDDEDAEDEERQGDDGALECAVSSPADGQPSPVSACHDHARTVPTLASETTWGRRM
jgi:hypothetical protein